MVLLKGLGWAGYSHALAAEWRKALEHALIAGLRARILCIEDQRSICVAPTALERILQLTHTSGFACARLQCGLTCGRASSAWILVHVAAWFFASVTYVWRKKCCFRDAAAEQVPHPAPQNAQTRRFGDPALRLAKARRSKFGMARRGEKLLWEFPEVVLWWTNCRGLSTCPRVR
jgi:hypothetical protein